ncbi:MAG TPA: hypothetical protein VIJ36_19365 [Thermoanaerobaculia bacterium]
MGPSTDAGISDMISTMNEKRSGMSLKKPGAPLREAAKAEGIARGMVARGIAESILAVLEVRGITVRPEQREEILGCSDVDRLKRWLREAILPTTEAAARD